MANSFANSQLFKGSTFGSPRDNSVVYTQDTGILGGESALTRQARAQHQAGLMTPQQKEEEKQQSSNNNFDQDQFKQTGTSTPTASQPTGSNLVSGGPGTGMAASYATDFGLSGATNAGQLGTYAGPTGLMSGTAAGTGAGWSGLGAASQGLTYGGSALGGAGASGLGAGASGATAGGAGWSGLGAASQGMTYGGSAYGTAAIGGGTAAGGGAAGGGAAGGGAMAGMGWFAALAAVIGTNEEYQRKKGNREDSDGKRILNAFTGRVVEQDAEGWGEKIDSDNKLGIKGDMQVAADFATLDWSNAVKGLDDTFGVKTIKKIFSF